MMNLQASHKTASSRTLYDIRPSAAASELLRRRMARRSLVDFTTYTKPDYHVNWHHRLLCEHLDRFVSGDIKRLMVFMPPRHGKSELVSRRLPSYLLGRDPDITIIACSYSADLSSRMNRDVQRIIDAPEYRRLFPRSELYGKNVRAVADGSYLRNSDIFEVVGHQGVYRSAGVGGGITGMGFHFGIIDDPIKDVKEAESRVVRDSIWDWYTGAFWTRQAPGARILLTMTRWHEDDLAGRLLAMAESDPKADQWTVLKLPGICENADTPNEQRAVGEVLWSGSAFDDDYFEAAKSQNIRLHEAMNQQNPTAREGSMFRIDQLTIVDAVPVTNVRCRGWDKASTQMDGDFTCGVRVARADDGIFYIEDVIKGQWDSAARDRIIRQTAELDGRDTYQIGEQEPGSGGKESAENFIRLLSGFAVSTERSTAAKELRADPFSSQVNAGNVRIVRGSWNRDYIEELRQFPNGKHDDQVDGSSLAFNKISYAGPGIWF